MQKSIIPDHDLTRIRGIGEARQRILRESFHVSHYSDLSRLNIDKALTLFKKKSEAVSREMLERWITDAKKLHAELIYSAQLTTGYPIKRPITENGWQAIATFVVDYQSKTINSDVDNHNIEERYRTTVHHIQTDSTQSWEGLDTVKYHHWINQKFVKSGGFKESTKQSTSHRHSASIAKVAFLQSQGEPIIANHTNVTIHSASIDKIELLLSVKGSEIDSDELNNIYCKIRCSLQKRDYNTFAEFTQVSPLLQTKVTGNFLAYINNVELKKGDYQLWFSIVLNSRHSVPDLYGISVLHVK